MIQIEDLTHIYPGKRKAAPRTALTDLTFGVAEGEFAILSGPNGSGKSTLFRILCGLAKPSKGRVLINGFDLEKDAARVREILGVVFQNPAVDKQLSVAENLKLHADLYGIGGADFIQRRTQALSWTDLADRLDQKVETLSGGLARQVELAKVLMTRPKVLLLDEPTTGLDPASRRNFLDALHRIQRDLGVTVLMTSHVFSEAENADRVIIMREGRLMASDTPQGLKDLLGTEMVVIRPHNAAAFAANLKAEMGIDALRYGDELRLEKTVTGEGLPILEKLLDRYRFEIASIAIKQPDLEDVFVHVTGREQKKTEV